MSNIKQQEAPALVQKDFMRALDKWSFYHLDEITASMLLSDVLTEITLMETNIKKIIK